jgi:hypothetical protein
VPTCVISLFDFSSIQILAFSPNLSLSEYMARREIRVYTFCFKSVLHSSHVALTMADLNEPQPGGTLFETADCKLSWRPWRTGRMSKSNLHIIQEAWAIPDGDGTNLITRQLLMLIYLPITQRRSKYYTSSMTNPAQRVRLQLILTGQLHFQ